MDKFERDSIIKYSADMKVAPTSEQLTHARKTISNHLKNDDMRESHAVDINFAYDDLRIQAHAVSVISPHSEETPEHLNMDYILGYEDEIRLSVSMPYDYIIPPMFDFEVIPNEEVAKILGIEAVRFLVNLVEFNAELTQTGRSDQHLIIEQGKLFILSLLRGGRKGLVHQSPLLEAMAKSRSIRDLPETGKIIEDLRKSLERSSLPQEYTTLQTVKNRLIIDGDTQVSPSFERHVRVNTANRSIEEMHRIELSKTYNAINNGHHVLINACKSLSLPFDSEPYFEITTMPSLSRRHTSSQDFINNSMDALDNPRLNINKKRLAVTGDLTYFVNALESSKADKSK